MHFGERIKERRKELGLNQPDVAKAAGVKVPSVSQWETGSTKSISGLPLAGVARILKTNSTWILTGRGDKNSTTSETSNKPELEVPLIPKGAISQLMAGEKVKSQKANGAIAEALGAGSKTFAYIETSEGMMHRITPKDTVYIDPEAKLEPNSVGIFLFKLGSDFELGTLKSTPAGLMLQFDSNEPGWDSIRVNEDDYIGRLVAYIPHWLGQ
jgi:transcriptional regulator with XRE-family HTH domain|tara:strand:- start:8270 stop:8905 length:636 start_codon:yes stop_codon:yes gene_type:complete